MKLSTRLFVFVIFAIIWGLIKHPEWLGLSSISSGFQESSVDLSTARKGFVTKLTKQVSENSPPDDPPDGVFELVKYPSELGKCAAYLSPPQGDGQKHPAIIWIVGGFSNSIGAVAWEPASPDNDQSASAFREAGILMMYPSLRGGNVNPGSKESFFGEVNDILSARTYLASRPDVEPNRIYLGGHSTGGTLALLVAENTDLFRAVFSFGPVSDPAGYGAKYLNYNANDENEDRLRAPGKWLASIHKPTFVLEGMGNPSNIDELESMKSHSTNPLIHFCPIPNKTHFSTLFPATHLIAQKILQDTGPQCNIGFTDQELVFP